MVNLSNISTLSLNDEDGDSIGKVAQLSGILLLAPGDLRCRETPGLSGVLHVPLNHHALLHTLLDSKPLSSEGCHHNLVSLCA
jgi:hypothetical protein